MTTKAEFNAEEWSRVVSGPFVAGLTVIAADRGGTVRETLEMAKVYAKERQDANTPELLSAIISDRPSVDPNELGASEDESKPAPEDVRMRGHELIRDALGILEGKATPEEIQAYKEFCLEIAQRVAERTKSGGVLGIGGERVSGSEMTAIDELRATLGVPGPGAGATGSDAGDTPGATGGAAGATR